MSTITKERIELFIKNPLENGLTRGEQMELARIALASLEAEAVAYMHHSGQVVTREECCDDKIFAICCKVETPLYAAPQLPQPVVAITQHFDTIALDTAKMVMCDVNRRDEFFGGDIQLLSRIQCRIDEACRAAMLQSDGPLTNEGTMQLSGNSEQIEPVSNRDELPLDYLQGHKDGLEWAAQLAEANHPQTGDWLYDDPIDLARAIRKGPDMPTVQAGNSPVTPDGSANEHGKAVGWNAYRAAMLQGADRPQNEPQNIPENIPATQFKPVADLYGLTSPTGGETSFTFDAVEARDFIDGGWSCQEYVELERFQEAVSGNPPVIPDSWTKCSERMPEKDGKYLVASSFGIVTAWFDPAWSNKFQDCDTNCDEGMEDFEGKVFRVTHWQSLPAAPKQGDE